MVQVVQFGSLITYVSLPLTQTTFQERAQAADVLQHAFLHLLPFSEQLHKQQYT